MPAKLSCTAFLFDLEGTLVDFQWNLKNAASEIITLLAEHGIDPAVFGPDPDYARLFNTTQAVIDTWPPVRAEALLNQLLPVYDSYDADALSRWELYPDTVPTLEALTRGNYRMGLVSNCGRSAVTRVLERFALTRYFEVVISRNEVRLVKPSPEGLLAACRSLGLSARQVLFVGDSVNDIRPANDISMPSCFLKNGESRVTGLNEHHATYEISSLAGLLTL